MKSFASTIRSALEWVKFIVLSVWMFILAWFNLLIAYAAWAVVVPVALVAGVSVGIHNHLKEFGYGSVLARSLWERAVSLWRKYGSAVKHYAATYGIVLATSTVLTMLFTHFAIIAAGYTVLNWTAYLGLLAYYSVAEQAITSLIVTGVIAVIDYFTNPQPALVVQTMDGRWVTV